MVIAGVLRSRSHWVHGCLAVYTTFSTRKLSGARGINLVSLLYIFRSSISHMSPLSPPNAICIRLACAALLLAIAVIGRDVFETDAASVAKVSTRVAPEEVCTCRVEVDVDDIACIFLEPVSLALVIGGAGNVLISTSVDAMTPSLGSTGGVDRSGGE